jgi:hypothetical protein
MVVVAIPGVEKEVPVPRETPPDGEEYQFIVPADAVAPRVTEPGPQIAPGVVPVIVGIGLTVIEIVLAALVPQPFVAVTLNTPLVADELKFIVTEFPDPIIVCPVPE